MGATMRLGELPIRIEKNTLAYKIYNKDEVGERHRHRYEVNPDYIKDFEKNGLDFSAKSLSGRRMEILEIPDHIHFLATQFHPEFKSRPMKPSPVSRRSLRLQLRKKVMPEQC